MREVWRRRDWMRVVYLSTKSRMACSAAECRRLDWAAMFDHEGGLRKGIGFLSRQAVRMCHRVWRRNGDGVKDLCVSGRSVAAAATTTTVRYLCPG